MSSTKNYFSYSRQVASLFYIQSQQLFNFMRKRGDNNFVFALFLFQMLMDLGTMDFWTNADFPVTLQAKWTPKGESEFTRRGRFA